jgi:hypothetical protein
MGNVNYTATKGRKAVHLAEKFYSMITLFRCTAYLLPTKPLAPVKICVILERNILHAVVTFVIVP